MPTDPIYLTYTPDFRTDVTVSMPDGHGGVHLNSVNPERCLTPDSAFTLAHIISTSGYPCAVVSGPALGAYTDVFKGNVTISSAVPWLVFSGVNDTPAYAVAGLVAKAWVVNTNPDTALHYALNEVKNVIAGN